MNPIIKCEHTDFGYENHDAVIDLNLEIYPGDYLCVVGENGSGKSTLPSRPRPRRISRLPYRR